MNVMKQISLLAVALCCSGICLAATVPAPRATLTTVPGDARGIVFSPDGKRIAVSTGQAIVIWEWSLATPIEMKPISGGTGVTFSADSSLIAFPGQDETYSDGLIVWDIAAGKKRLFLADDNVQSPVFSPDGKMLSAAVGSQVKMWKFPSGEVQAPLKDGHKCSISNIAYTSTGKVMISADGKGTVLRWELGEAGPVKKGEYKPATDENSISSLACSADGKWVAASTGDGLILVLDATTLAPVAKIKAHKDGLRVRSIAFSADSKMIASACSGVEDLEIKLWNVGTQKQILGFLGHGGAVNCVAFSPDGKWLASGSDDRSAKVWEVEALLAMVAPKPEKPKKEKPNQ